MSDAILKLDRINSFYGPIQVHFDLSIEIPRGQIVCLLGGNASGKSTTMKVILGLLKPRSGEITLEQVRTAIKPLEIDLKRPIAVEKSGPGSAINSLLASLLFRPTRFLSC